MSKSVKTITAVTYLMLGGVAASVGVTMSRGRLPSQVGFGCLALVAVIALGATQCWIRRYSLNSQGVWIYHGWFARCIPLAEIQSWERKSEVFRGALRLFASGGVWSYFGRFYSKPLGHFFAYLSATERAVLIRTQKRSVLISPSNPDQFLADLQAAKAIAE